MKALLNRFKDLKVAVIGDIMLDHYIWGDSQRISPEAPVPVIDVDHDSFVPGGAANVALNITSLGAKAYLFGSAANDDAGAQLATILNKRGVTLDPRFSKIDAPTILKTRVIVRNQQLCRIDRESVPSDYEILDEDLWDVMLERLKSVNAIIFSDYYKGVINNQLVERIQQFAKEYNIFLAMDPKPRRQLSFKGLDLMTPNRIESVALSQIDVEPHQKYPAAEVCEAMWKRYETKHLVVTLGADGMLLSKEGKITQVIPTVAQEVFDVSGAGDTVIAALTLGLTSGASIEDSSRLANIAAGVVVSKVGTATASPEEILAHEHAEDFSPVPVLA